MLGGSTTQGTATSTLDKRWANRMVDWWEEKYPETKFNLINSGIVGTNSSFGVHRLTRDVLIHEPDLVIVEFSINDTPGDEAQIAMEGITRQLLSYNTSPAIMFLLLKQSNGTTAATSHRVVGQHYKLPMIDYANEINEIISSDGIASINNLYSDGIHPNDLGMEYISKMFHKELNLIYNNRPNLIKPIEINSNISSPITANRYNKTRLINTENIIPSENIGWKKSIANSWTGDTSGATITFDIQGTSISLIYTKFNDKLRGRVDVWIDNQTPKTLDGYWTETWGKGFVFTNLANNLSGGIHKLHLKIRTDKTSDYIGNVFELAYICTAGEIGSTPPIAVFSEITDCFNSTILTLDGSDSYSPSNDTITKYFWKLESKPKGSINEITNSQSNIAYFKPTYNGTYTLSLKVYTKNDSSIAVYKTINVKTKNTKPIAKIGKNITAKINQEITLNGSASYDADNDKLKYIWQNISSPSKSSYQLYYSTNSKAYTVISSGSGEFVYTLKVYDGFEFSNPDTISIFLGSSEIEIDDTQQKSAKEILYVSPNPAKDDFELRYELINNSNVKIQLVSYSGTIISLKPNGIEKAGKYSKKFNIQNLNIPQGIYLISLTINNKAQTSQLIIE
ncbi:MAG: T9SS type A sorting domain-containing protein [Bacteroidales bacterium]|nr:T9SS type A sorting domain-containing protein [Bacteroidales bacterium]